MEAARPLTKEAEVANIITTLAETRLMSPKDTKEEKQYYITNIIMGIKSFFSGLFDKSDNQMPSSLGNGKEVNPNYNLGSKSTLSVDDAKKYIEAGGNSTEQVLNELNNMLANG